MIKKIIAAAILGCAQLGIFQHTALMAQTNRPNFIVILADDLGWTSHSYIADKRYPASGSSFYETPYIDRLVQSGMLFSQGYAPAAICCPSRRSIQFGQTPARLGDTTFQRKYLSMREKWPTIPGLLK